MFPQLAGSPVTDGHPACRPGWPSCLRPASRPTWWHRSSDRSGEAHSPRHANTPIFLVFPTSDDDIVFEDFARQRLKGMKEDKEEEEEGTGSPRLNDR